MQARRFDGLNETREKTIKQTFPNLLYEIDDSLIGIFDNVFSKNYCEAVIDYFHRMEKAGAAHYRSQRKDVKTMMNVQDQSVDLMNYSHLELDELVVNDESFENLFWFACYPLYVERVPVLTISDPHFISDMKIQKTRLSEGYHVWHSETTTRAVSNRLMAFSVFLNDVAEGGETEFLYQRKRIAAKQGRLALWPAGYTHVHRGNPPMSGEKYILTGWVQY